jgi:mannose-1-phosphate guanylyltransferase
MKFAAALLAGGSGERFWPWSRQAHPKQFLKLDGQFSLIQATWHRMDQICPPEQRIIVTQERQKALVQEHLPNLEDFQLLLEPCARDTAAAVLLTTLHLKKRFGDVVIGIFPSDHHIADQVAFDAAVQTAISEAEKGGIITFGIQPTHPATGYGYIEQEITSPAISNRVKRFTEKPNLARAEEMLQAGNYLWNAGMFFFRADVMLALFQEFAPQLYAALEPIIGTDQINQIYPSLQKISLDYAIMEHAPNVRVIPVSFGWDDVGDWAALKRLSSSDNVCLGKHIALETHRSVVVNQSKELVVTLGLEDVVVVHCDDVTLVMPKDRAQDVKQILQALRNDPTYVGLV